MIVTYNNALADELAHFDDEPDTGARILWTDAYSSLFDVLN
jgi:hypothetical protein